MDRETYRELLLAEGLADEYFSRAVEQYRTEAMSCLGAKIETEIRAWHDEHLLQTFFSGQSADEDVSVMNVILQEAWASGGEGFLR